jgi:2-hydroxychromene-2-carboxylate isomerase
VSQPVEFYFDFSSPYAYLATAEIDALAAKHHRAVTWRPMMLGIALKATGNKPLVDVPMKGDYMRRDVPRTAKRLGLPFTWPEKFPYAAIAPSRAFYWIAGRDETKAKLFARAIFAAYFGHGRGVDTPEAVAEVASHLGVPVTDTLAALQDQAVKDKLKTETEAAIAKGVFGAPFFFVDGEPYWGQDRLADVARFLEERG